MTPTEAAAAFETLKKAIGEHAHIHVSLLLSGHYGAIQATLYPRGLVGSDDCRVTAFADEFGELLVKLRTLWAESADRIRAERIRKMALEIIRITAEQGTCTDAALRAGDFTDREVDEYGAEAVEDANSIAQNGPFSITKLAGANAA